MPDEHALAPAPAPIDVGQRLAEGENAVVAVEIEAPDRVGVAHRAMMRIMKEQREPRAAPTRRADGGNEPGLVPLVHEDQVGVGRRCVEIASAPIGADESSG